MFTKGKYLKVTLEREREGIAKHLFRDRGNDDSHFVSVYMYTNNTQEKLLIFVFVEEKKRKCLEL